MTSYLEAETKFIPSDYTKQNLDEKRVNKMTEF